MNSNISISKSTLKNNIKGGAIKVINGNAAIESSSFLGNMEDAIYLVGSKNISIHNSIFRNNFLGRALLLKSIQNLTLSNNIF